MSRDPSPWPPDTLDQLRPATTVGVLTRVTITWQADPSLEAEPLTFDVGDIDTLDIMEDAAGRPLTRVTIVTADRSLFTMLPPDAFRDRTARVALHACYEWGDLASAPQMFGGELLDVEDTGTAYRITAVSRDATDDYPHFGARMTPHLYGETPTVGLVMDTLEPAGTTDHWPQFALRRDSTTRPPIRSSSTSALLGAMALDTGDNLEDFVAGLLDCYPNSAQLPDRDGLRITVSERITPTTDSALDLRAGQGLTLTAPQVQWGPDDWGNVLRLTATWRGADGREVSQTIVRAHESVWQGLALVRVVDVRRSWRPPNDNINNAPEVPAQLLSRLWRRSWRATLQAKPMLWVRPGDPVRVTDDLLGVVTSIRHTMPGGLAAVTVRPI